MTLELRIAEEAVGRASGEEREEGRDGGLEAGEVFGRLDKMTLSPERLEFGGLAGEGSASQAGGGPFERVCGAANGLAIAARQGTLNGGYVYGAVFGKHADQLGAKRGVSSGAARQFLRIEDHQGNIRDHDALRFIVR